jgi:hypothetical protein
VVSDYKRLLEATFLKVFLKEDSLSREHSARAALGPLLSADASSFLMSKLGGTAFGQGVYRLHSIDGAAGWTRAVIQAFPSYTEIECFGSDWLGRQFALSPKHRVQDEPGVLMFEPGTGQVLTIPATFLSFHTEELIEYTDAALARSAYEGWLENGGAKPTYQECIGYKVPLFLGGADNAENMEKTDMEVYWQLTAQLLVQARNLQDGTAIGKVSIE